MTTIINKKHLGSLTTETRNVLPTSDENRIKYIRRKKFISYPYAETVLAKLERLMLEPKAIKMPFYLILGADNSGKTTIAKEFLRRHPVTPASDCGCIEKMQPVVYIEAPKGPQEDELYNRILECLSMPFKRSDHPSKKVRYIRYHFNLFDVKVLIIDNFNVPLHGPTMRRSAFMNAIKILSSKLRIPIVLLGHMDIIDAINTDIVISSDYLPTVFTKRAFDANSVAFLSAMEKTLPLKNPSNLVSSVVARKILEQSKGYIGGIVKIMTKAAIKSIINKTEKISSSEVI